jgi:hypothetical protein
MCIKNVPTYNWSHVAVDVVDTVKRYLVGAIPDMQKLVHPPIVGIPDDCDCDCD